MADGVWRRLAHTGSVRVRMTIAAVVVVAVGLTAAGAGLVGAVERDLVGGLREADRAAVDDVSRQIESGVIPRRIPLRSQYVQIIGPDGRVIGSSLSVIGVEPMLRGGEFVAPAPQAGTRLRLTERFVGHRWEVVVEEVPSQEGPLTVVAASPLAEVERSVDTLVGILLVGIPAVVVLVGLLAWSLIGRALRPIEAIRSQVEEISATTMDRRVPEPGTGDEVDRLAHTMNVMLDRLESASDRQRRFVSDASHELRSPVAAIRTELEVALRQADVADWPRVAQAVLAEDERLADLIADLLELARLDEGSPAPFEEVDLDDLALEAGERLRRRTAIEVDTSSVSAARVHGNRRQLERLLRNLVDNAGRHAGGRVRIALGTFDDEARLVVDDDGSGIDEADRSRVFDRFMRLEEGRSRDQGGTGLGLALVREVAEHHGGSVSVSDGPLGGARFEVVLPAPA